MEKDNEEMQLKDILIKLSEYKLYLLKKKSSIISASMLFLIIGLLYELNSDVNYNAELTFVVESDQSGGSLGAMSGIASQFGFDIGSGSANSTFSQQNILELLKSRGVVVAALMQNGVINGKTDLLIEHYLRINQYKEDWDDIPIYFTFHGELTQTNDSVSGDIWRTICVDKLLIELQSDDANIINLSYSSLSDEFAKQFVESLIKQMSKMYVEHQTAQASNTLDFLQDRADSVFVELEIAEEEFAKVKDVNQRIVKATGRLKELQLMRNVEVLGTMYLEIVKNLELSKITLLNNTPIINIIDRPILPLEQSANSKILLSFLGAFLGGFLSISFFVFKKIFKDSLI